MSLLFKSVSACDSDASNALRNSLYTAKKELEHGFKNSFSKYELKADIAAMEKDGGGFIDRGLLAEAKSVLAQFDSCDAACAQDVSSKSLYSIAEAQKAIANAKQIVATAYQTYVRELGREKPNANIKEANSEVYKLLETAQAKTKFWLDALYNSQNVF